ncbi:transporter substrate-binding domain-containing protein [Ornithinibacillus bavariensis]|uniref:ABC transporter extracellular-binding protein YckB n=1 Tax=Ornithinibacillus bavariensis TaxID=545502 RepID=A0A919X8C2_9BACI|nr:transporter substrate-binding domain-containing protein [Ornithinibacillus bavariensis]GIO27876.1 putative ABC transporter extracellular-binding protein YckB [Ornithinibacillus bavariensis]
MKKIIWLTILSSIFLLLSACGNDTEEKTEDKIWASIQESGEIVVGTAGTLFPASYYPEGSEELTGYDVEVAREIGKRLGVDVKFETMAFDAMLSALQSGRVDMIQAGPREASRDKFGFSEPIKYSFATMIVRADDLSGIHTLEDLKGKKAGGAATTVYSDIARKFDAEVVTYGNVTNDAYLRDVHNGRTDVVINDYYLQKLAITAFPEFNITLHPDLRFHPTTNNVVVSKEAKVLLKKIDEVIADMKEDGTLTKISGEFFGGLDVSKEPEEEVIEIEGID